jgi:transcriptional regulator with XRE-family HTH domain
MKRRTPQVPTTKGAKLLREWLDKTDTSQGELAELIGVGQATVSKWLGAHSPRIRHAMKLSSVTGIPIRQWGTPLPAARSAA